MEDRSEETGISIKAVAIVIVLGSIIIEFLHGGSVREIALNALVDIVVFVFLAILLTTFVKNK